MNQIEYFNSIAENWDNICNHDKNKINTILSLLNIKKGDNILDVGTGTGILIPYLYALTGSTGKITAIDFSENMINLAKARYDFNNVNFIHGDVLDTDFTFDYFDHIICFSVFPHFEDKQAAITVLNRFIKSEGCITICHSQSRDAINNLHKNKNLSVSNDNLPKLSLIKTYFKNVKMETIFEVDNDDIFVITAKK